MSDAQTKAAQSIKPKHLLSQSNAEVIDGGKQEEKSCLMFKLFPA